MIRGLLVALALLLGWPGAANAGPRKALVVGISQYRGLRLLPNAVADAQAVADALERVGFQVTRVMNPDEAALRAAVAQAAATQPGENTATDGAPVRLFYYAGHAVQYHQRNYLLAADVNPLGPELLDQHGLDLSRTVGRLQPASLRLIFVDACRDNPLAFAVEGTGAPPGLAPMPAGVGTTVVFSAAPGQAAEDGEGGGHSPFAAALLRRVLTPGLELSALLRDMTRDMLEATNGRQQIEPRDNRRESFFFVPPGINVAQPAPPPIAGLTRRQGTRVDVLLAKLEPAAGTKRLYGLEDALRTGSLEPGLDAGQALAILGDIPAFAMRRRALGLLLPSLLAPVSEPEAARLLESFTGTARGTTIELLLPCLARPMSEGAAARILGDTPPPLRAILARALAQPAGSASSCPASHA